MILSQIATAISPNLTTAFSASGGTPPYTYSVRSDGAGGTINASTGIYTAPSSVNQDQAFDTIQVRDSVGAIATATILVTTPLGLLCDIIQNQMGLPAGRVYFWDQKVFQPTDAGLYVAVSVPNCKPFGNNIGYDGGGSGLESNQYINVMATVDIDIISRGPDARDLKEKVLMTLNSVYSERQQEANSFHISRLSTAFVNLSNIDGAAIPYRYKITVAMQYAVTGDLQINYFDSFDQVGIVVNA